MKVNVEVVRDRYRGPLRLVERMAVRVSQRISDEAWRRTADEASAHVTGADVYADAAMRDGIGSVGSD